MRKIRSFRANGGLIYPVKKVHWDFEANQEVMMRSATRDLLRLSLTAGAVAGILLFANFEASRVVAPVDVAMARSDSIRYVRTISVVRKSTGPDFVLPRQLEPEAAPPDNSVVAPSAKLRSLVAFAQ